MSCTQFDIASDWINDIGSIGLNLNAMLDCRLNPTQTWGVRPWPLPHYIITPRPPKLPPLGAVKLRSNRWRRAALFFLRSNEFSSSSRGRHQSFHGTTGRSEGQNLSHYFEYCRGAAGRAAADLKIIRSRPLSGRGRRDFQIGRS